MVNHGYELFDNTGGHCGPFFTLEHALSTARRRIAGCHSLDSVRIVERTASGVGGFGQTVMTVRRIDDDPQANQMAY